MSIAGYTLLILGSIASLIGHVMLLGLAYKRGLLWFFGCLVLPLVWIIFLLLNLPETAKPFAIFLAGLLVACLGGWMAGIEFW